MKSNENDKELGNISISIIECSSSSAYLTLKKRKEREREKEKGTDTYPINTYKRSIRIDSSSIYPTNI